MTCAVMEQQLIEVSAGGGEYTWPTRIYELNGNNISGDAVTAAVVPFGAVPSSYVTPDILTYGSMTVATYRSLHPGDILKDGLADSALIYYAAVQQFIGPAVWSLPPYNLILWLKLVAFPANIVREAGFGISVR